MTPYAKGLLITGIGGFVLTFDIPMLKLGGGEVWSVLLVRSGFAFIASILIWRLHRLVTGRAMPLVPGRSGVLVAVIYGLSAICFITAAYNTTAANLVFILAFNTMFAALLGRLFLGERLRPVTLVTMAVVLLAVGVIVADGIAFGNSFGDAFAVLSALLIAAAITIARGHGGDMGYTPMVGGLLPTLVAAAFLMTGRADFEFTNIWWIIANGAILMPAAFWCLATGPRYLAGAEVAMFYLLETVLAPIWVWLIFAEAPTNRTLVAGLVIVAALVAHSLWQINSHRRKAAVRVSVHP